MSQRPGPRPWAAQHILLMLLLGPGDTRDQGSHSPTFPPNSPSLPPPSWANSGHLPGPPGGWVSPWQSGRLKGDAWPSSRARGQPALPRHVVPAFLTRWGALLICPPQSLHFHPNPGGGLGWAEVQAPAPWTNSSVS